MVGLIVLGLAFLFFIVVAYFAAKTWHVGHVVVLVFLFLNTLCFLFLTATLLRIHQKFQPAYQDAVAGLERAEQEARTLRFGQAGVAAGDTSLVGAQGLARSELLARGRVWRNLRRVQGPNITLNTANWRNDGCAIVGQDPADEAVPEPVPDEELAGEVGGEGAEAPAAASNPHGITENQFVHAFKEFPIARFLKPAEKEFYFGQLEGEENFADRDQRGTCRVPLAYLGKFRIAATTDQTVSLVPEWPLEPAQQKMANDQATWVLYEKLPLDAHDLFRDVPPEQLSELIPLDRLNQLGVNLTRPQYGARWQDYWRDGKPTDERAGAPERKGMTVEFLKEHEVVVDLQVEGDLPDADQPFTPDGRAQVQHLMQRDAEGNSMPATKFSPGQVAKFDYATGLRLVQQGIAKRMDVTFVRQLRDFEYEFDSFHARSAKLQDQIAVAERDLASLNQSTQTLRDQIARYEAEERLLAADFEGFSREQEQLGQYLGRLQRRFEGLKREINRLYFSPQATLTRPLALAP